MSRQNSKVGATDLSLEFTTVYLDNLKPGKYEKLRILKNVIGLALVFVLIFTAFLSTANLQSTLHSKNGLGGFSLAALYGGILVSSSFLPSLMIKLLKCKGTMIVSVIGYAVYIAAQFYPRFETLIPAAFIRGFCGAMLWSAQPIYISKLAEKYAELTSTPKDAVTQRLFGMFFLIFQSAHIFGNLIQSYLLTPEASESDIYSNITRHVSHCGVNFCPAGISTTETENVAHAEIRQPDPDQVTMLMGIYLAFTVGSAFLLMFVLDPLSRYGENKKIEGAVEKSITELVLATFLHLRNPLQILLIPFTFWYGITTAFYGLDFTVGFISCAWGVEHIGYVMICYGVCAALASFIAGAATKYIGRPPVFIAAAALNVAANVLMLFWELKPNQPMFFFLLAGMYGTCGGTLISQMNALYSSVFPTTKEAGFSNVLLWQSLGFVIAYISGPRFCMEAKLYGGIIVAIVAVSTYLIVEVIIRRRVNAAKVIAS